MPLSADAHLATFQRIEQQFLRLVADADVCTAGFRYDFVDYLLLSRQTSVLLVPDECAVAAWHKELCDLGAGLDNYVRFLAPGWSRRTAAAMRVATFAEWVACPPKDRRRTERYDRVLVDLSDPAATTEMAPTDLPVAKYTWGLLSRHSTPEQRRWAYRVVSDKNLWCVGVDDDASVRRCPNLRIGEDVEAALPRIDGVSPYLPSQERIARMVMPSSFSLTRTAATNAWYSAHADKAGNASAMSDISATCS